VLQIFEDQAKKKLSATSNWGILVPRRNFKKLKPGAPELGKKSSLSDSA
jgi:hypothetical protein